MKRMLVFPLIASGNDHCSNTWQTFTDSLQQAISKATNDTDRINLLNKLSYTYSLTNFQEGVRRGNVALSTA